MQRTRALGTRLCAALDRERLPLLRKCRLASRRFASEVTSYHGSPLSFAASSTDRSFLELARKFATEEVMPASAALDRSGEYPVALFSKAWELGLVNVHVPPSCGGAGLSNLAGSIIAEELAFADTGVTTAIEINSVAAMPVILAGTEEQKKHFLGRLTEAPVQAAYAVTEPGAGSDVAGIKTRAEKKGDEWVINGSKMWITNAGRASWYFVLARTGAAGEGAGSAFTAFLVDRETPGIEVGRKEDMLGQRCSDTRGITFSDVRVPAKNVLGAPGKGFKLAMQVFDYTRPPVAALAVGLGRRALHEATQYALQRTTFGVPLAQHQGVSFKLADMATGVEAARLLTYKAAWLLDEGRPNGAAAAAAKLFASEHAQKCVQACAQIYGGAGFSNETIASKLYRDALITTVYEGASEMQRLIISRDMVAAATRSLA